MTHIRPEGPFQQEFFMTHEHVAISATTSVKLFEFARRCSVTRVSYINPTGLVEDAVNFMDVQIVKEGSVVVANHSTETGQEGTIPADDSINLVQGSDTLFQAGETLSFDVVEAGTATLPAGRIMIEGVYL